jgi:tetratricopeptide (TPR) repeat protein
MRIIFFSTFLIINCFIEINAQEDKAETKIERVNSNTDSFEKLDSLIKNDSLNGLLYLRRGMLFIQSRQIESGLADFNKLIDIKPNSWTGYSNRGICKAMMSDMEGAIQDLTLALENLPESLIGTRAQLEIIFNRGYSYIELKEFEHALNDFSEISGNDLEFPYINYYQGICLYNLKKDNEALIQFDSSINKYPDYSLAYRFKGLALIYLGEKEEACKILNKAVELGDKVSELIVTDYNCK